MKTINFAIDDDIIKRKNHAGVTWKGLILSGLDFVEGRKKENARIAELEEIISHMERQIGVLTRLLQNSDYATKILNEAKNAEDKR